MPEKNSTYVVEIAGFRAKNGKPVAWKPVRLHGSGPVREFPTESKAWKFARKHFICMDGEVRVTTRAGAQ